MEEHSKDRGPKRKLEDRPKIENRLQRLVEQILSTKDLTTAQGVAVELQWAVYEYLEELRTKAPSSAPSSEDESSSK